LTSQAGLIPVVKYLDRIGFEKTVKRKVAHPRGDNADYQDNADGVKNTVNGWVQQRKWPALFRQKPLNIQLISMVTIGYGK
jgi:hypothetical protein